MPSVREGRGWDIDHQPKRKKQKFSRTSVVDFDELDCLTDQRLRVGEVPEVENQTMEKKKGPKSGERPEDQDDKKSQKGKDFYFFFLSFVVFV